MHRSEMVLCRHSEETASINKPEYVYNIFHPVDGVFDLL